MTNLVESANREAIIIAFVNDYQNSVRMRAYAQARIQAGALLICADSGGEVALAWGLTPRLLLGDMDSIALGALQFLDNSPEVQVQRFPVAKDETDLELAMLAAIERGCQKITLMGGLGGRLDQTLGNLYLLALPRLLDAAVEARLIGEQEQVWLLQGPRTLEFEGQPGNTVSLIPLTNRVEGVSNINLLYPLHDETLFLSSTRGISNVITANPATISLKSGSLFVIHRSDQSE